MPGIPGLPGAARDRYPAWRELLRTAAALVFLPLLGALVAYRLTTPPGPGPLGFVRTAEAPPVEVAGVRAVEDPLGLGALAGLRAPVGAASGDPAFEARAALPRPGELAGALETGDGILIRVPGDATRGAWPATVGLTPTGVAVPAPIALKSAEGVLGATDGAVTTEAPAGPPIPTPAPPPPGIPVGAVSGELLYRALEPPPADWPGPRVLKLFAVVALAPDGVPVGRFTTPLTVTVPFDPAAVNGRLALASYDASAGWVELAGLAISPQRAIVSAQLPEPAVVALLENRPPLATPESAETAPDVPLTLDVLANDSDPDGDQIAIFERTTTSAAGGAVTCVPTGSCTYTPPPSFTGEDTFTYGLGDLRSQAWTGNTAEGTVTVLVRQSFASTEGSIDEGGSTGTS